MAKRGSLIFLTALLLALAPLVIAMALPFLTAFALASILAIVLKPADDWVRRRVHRPGLSAFLTTIAAVLVLGAILTIAGVILTQELTSAYDAVSRRSVEEGGWPALFTHATNWALDTVATRLPVDKEAIRAEIFERMNTLMGYLVKKIGPAVGGITSAVITSLLVAIFLYFLLRYGETWVDQLAVLIPLDGDASARLIRTIKNSVSANVNGVLAVAAAQGCLLSLGFWIVGLKSALLWGAVGGLASIIPMVGSTLVWVPVVIAFVIMGSYGKALMLALWGTLIVGSVDNILRPYVVGVYGKQHPMLMALAMIGGTYAFGVLGILLGPLIISLVEALVQEIQRLSGGVSSAEPVEAHER